MKTLTGVILCVLIGCIVWLTYLHRSEAKKVAELQHQVDAVKCVGWEISPDGDQWIALELKAPAKSPRLMRLVNRCTHEVPAVVSLR